MFETTWQDLVLLIGNFIFFAALVPSIISSDKPSRWTSLPTAIVLTVFAFTYYSLGLNYGTFMVALSAIAWWVLFFQMMLRK